MIAAEAKYYTDYIILVSDNALKSEDNINNFPQMQLTTIMSATKCIAAQQHINGVHYQIQAFSGNDSVMRLGAAEWNVKSNDDIITNC